MLMGDGSPLEVKFTASQILGVSQATLRSDSESALCKDAFHSFRRAIELQQDAGVITGQAETSELALCFSKLSLTEFHTLEEIKSVESSQIALQAHAFLVGERLFPPTFKQRYLYPSLTDFASLLMFHTDMVEGGFQIFSYTLGLERCGSLKLGTVLGHIAAKYPVHSVYNIRGPQPLVRQRARELLCAYDSVVNNVHIDSLLGLCHSFSYSFGSILYAEPLDYSSFDDLKSTLEDVEKLLRSIRGRMFRERQDEYPKMPSVAHEIMRLLMDTLRLNSYVCGDHLLMLKFVFLRVLLWDNASYQDECNGATVLHILAYSAIQGGHVEGIQDLAPDLALAFLRHGCPLDAVDKQGYTATDLLRHEGREDQNINLIQTLVSPPTTVLRLEEAAARVVLRHKINYQDVLPLRLRELVDGGTAELELKLLEFMRANDVSSEEGSEESSEDSE
ncbi:uncharacterized protein LOC100890783 [Strongylocentrotus purpuratus]|uniref:Uncharacterized protein n=1 Tax=Strongylocentrotus purpuratus TaxID=7668 RepID=A0A7M7PJE5_STRPU|nr:uncharacterized protein LOC100890783 [Strongylocentrotus purpuratus]